VTFFVLNFCPQFLTSKLMQYLLFSDPLLNSHTEYLTRAGARLKIRHFFLEDDDGKKESQLSLVSRSFLLFLSTCDNITFTSNAVILVLIIINPHQVLAYIRRNGVSQEEEQVAKGRGRQGIACYDRDASRTNPPLRSRVSSADRNISGGKGACSSLFFCVLVS
jgi:hypothetical protein